MLFWIVAFLVFRIAPAQAFDNTEYKLIDLRAVSIRGGLSNYRLEKQAKTRTKTLPQGLQGPSSPAAQPGYGAPAGYAPRPTGFVPQPNYAMQSYPAPQRQTFTAPPPSSAVPVPAPSAPSAQTVDIENYIKSNPQVIPDV